MIFHAVKSSANISYILDPNRSAVQSLRNRLSSAPEQNTTCLLCSGRRAGFSEQCRGGL